MDVGDKIRILRNYERGRRLRRFFK